MSHEPSQHFPLSPRKHLQLRQERRGARRARELLQRARTFIWYRVDDNGPKLLIEARAVLLLLLLLRQRQRRWRHMRQVEEMVRDVVPGRTRRALRRKVFRRRESARPFV